jgi:hypothetical protein
MSDFGLSDKYTGIMKGVACSVDPGLLIHDLTHNITPFGISEAAGLLSDTLRFWPPGTTFVVVVDPGVGSSRNALAVLTRSDHFIFCPDNGLLTSVDAEYGIREIRKIDILKNRYPGNALSSTFHGRDIFVFNGAMLASGKCRFSDMGYLFTSRPVILNYPEAIIRKNKIEGIITRIEEPFGNFCTNIRADLVTGLALQKGRGFKIIVSEGKKILFSGEANYANTFSEVSPGQLLIYIDSLGKLGIARNLGRVTDPGKVNAGKDTRVIIQKI